MKGMPLKQQIEIVNKYNSGINTGELSKEYNTKQSSMSYWLKQQTEVNWRGLRTYFFNEHYFDIIDTQEKAYWLGFICADGSINERDIRIELQERDQLLLEKLKQDLNLNAPIKITKHYKNGVLNDKKYCRINLCSKIMVKALITHNIKPRKTYNLEFPECIIEDFIPHFIRGLSDGDGCIYVQDNKFVRYIWKFVGTPNLNIKLKEIIEANFNVNVVTKPHWRSNCVNEITVYSPIEFLEWIYKDATVYLPRKYNKYLQIVNIETQKKHTPVSTSKKLTIEDVKEIKSIIFEGRTTLMDIAKRYNVRYHIIVDVKRGKTYKEVKYND